MVFSFSFLASLDTYFLLPCIFSITLILRKNNGFRICSQSKKTQPSAVPCMFSMSSKSLCYVSNTPMITEHLHPPNFLLLYKFTPAQTLNLLFADLQIPIHARSLPFSPIFHILSETLPFFGLLLQHCWLCLSFVVLSAYKKCSDYFWNKHLDFSQDSNFCTDSQDREG